MLKMHSLISSYKNNKYVETEILSRFINEKTIRFLMSRVKKKIILSDNSVMRVNVLYQLALDILAH